MGTRAARESAIGQDLPQGSDTRGPPEHMRGPPLHGLRYSPGGAEFARRPGMQVTAVPDTGLRGIEGQAVAIATCLRTSLIRLGVSRQIRAFAVQGRDTKISLSHKSRSSIRHPKI